MKVRNGDSVSFICMDFDRERRNIMLNNEQKPELATSVGRMIDAFKVKEANFDDHEQLEHAVQAVIKEQTGFEVKDEELGRIVNVGLVLVDGSDHFEHMFAVNVTGLEQDESDLDKTTYDLVWVSDFEISVINTWRPFAIWKKTEFISQQMARQEEAKTE